MLKVKLVEEMAAVLLEDLADLLARDVARVVFEVEDHHAGAVAAGVRGRGLGWPAGLRVEHGVGLLEEGAQGRGLIASGQEAAEEQGREVDVVLGVGVGEAVPPHLAKDETLEGAGGVGGAGGEVKVQVPLLLVGP